MSVENQVGKDLADFAGSSILIVSYHFYPSSAVGAKRPSELARALQESGADVTVLRCVHPVNQASIGIREIQQVDYVNVRASKKRISKIWVWLKRKRAVKPVQRSQSGGAVSSEQNESASHGLISRVKVIIRSYEELLGGEKSWLIRAFVKSHSLRHKKFDIVFVSGPIYCAYALGYVLASRHSSRLILDFRDPWHVQGDLDTNPSRANNVLAIWESKLRRLIVEQASLITVASHGIRDCLLSAISQDLPQIEVIRNGFDREMRIQQSPPSGSLQMLYSGTLYLNRNPFPLFEAIKQLIDSGQIDRSLIKLTMVGDCGYWEGNSTVEWVKESELDDVIKIVEPISPPEIRELMIESNVLINLAQGQPNQIPSKTYEYLASGRDVLLIAENDSDSARLQRESGIGEVVQDDNLDEIKRVVRRLFKKHCEGKGSQDCNTIKNLDRYSRVTMNQKFIGVIGRLLADS